MIYGMSQENTILLFHNSEDRYVLMQYDQGLHYGTPALSLDVMKLHYYVCLLLHYVQRSLHVVQTYLYYVSIWLCVVVLYLYSDSFYYIMSVHLYIM